MRGRWFLALAFLFMPLGATAQLPTCSPLRCGNYTGGTNYPFMEFGTSSAVQVMGDGNWVDVAALAAPCMATVANIRSTGEFNLAARAYLEFTVSGAQAGARYETDIYLVPVGAPQTHLGGGWHAKTVRNIQSNHTLQPPNDTYDQKQADWYHGVHISDPSTYKLVAGDYRLSLKVRLFGGGTMNISQIFIHGQGAPVAYGGNRFGNAPQQTVDGTWRKVVETQVTNNSGAVANYALQGYFEIVGGTPGNTLAVGFTYDNQSSGTHYATVYVPAELPSGIHVRDLFPNETFAGLPTGTHNLQIWMKNLSLGQTQIENAELQAVGFPEMFANRSNYTTASDPVTVNSTVLEDPQPDACGLRDDNNPDLAPCTNSHPPLCGYWKKLLSLSPQEVGTNLQPMYDAYVELLGHSDPAWANSNGQVAIELVGVDNLNRPYALENGLFIFDIPAGQRHISVHGDAAILGINSRTIVNLWIRKETCEPGGNESVTFTVGKRYLGLRTMPIDPQNTPGLCYNE